MANEVVIETASAADREIVLDLMTALAAQHAQYDARWQNRDDDTGQPPTPPGRECFESLVDDHLAGGPRWLGVARLDGVVVGMAMVELRTSKETQSVLGYLENLMVDPAARGRGVGRALTEAAVAWVRACQGESIDLEVAAANAGAQKFYDACGFRPITYRLTRAVTPWAGPRTDRN